MVKQKAYGLLQEAINQGVGALGQSLETELKRHILFIMHDGMEYYPEKKPAGEDIRQVIKVLPSFSDEQFYYLQTRQLLVLKVSLPQGVGCLYLLIRKVEEPEIPVIMKSVEPARLALTCFLRNEITVQQRVEQKTNDILSQAFESRQFCMEDFLADFDIRLDPSQGYYVMLVDFCRSIPDSTVVDFKASLMQFECKHREVTAYPLFWRGKGVVILQDLREQEGWASAEVDASLRAFIIRWQKSFSKRYGVSLSIGVGDCHPLRELKTAYREAEIALAYGETKSQRGFCRCFQDVGLLRPLFAGGIEPVLTFCRRTLGRIMDYDRDNEADLLITLKLLMETKSNYKATAEMLFVHVNTVRYRYDKIAQLLEKDLSDPDVCFDLYVAVRMSEILSALHLLPVRGSRDLRDKQHGRRASGAN